MKRFLVIFLAVMLGNMAATFGTWATVALYANYSQRWEAQARARRLMREAEERRAREAREEAERLASQYVHQPRPSGGWLLLTVKQELESVRESIRSIEEKGVWINGGVRMSEEATRERLAELRQRYAELYRKIDDRD